MKKLLISYLRIYFTAIIILLSLVVVVWLCGCVVVRSRGRAGVWCGFCGCHFSFFSFRFLHIGTYRLPPYPPLPSRPRTRCRLWRRTLPSADRNPAAPSTGLPVNLVVSQYRVFSRYMTCEVQSPLAPLLAMVVVVISFLFVLGTKGRMQPADMAHSLAYGLHAEYPVHLLAGGAPCRAAPAPTELRAALSTSATWAHTKRVVSGADHHELSALRGERFSDCRPSCVQPLPRSPSSFSFMRSEIGSLYQASLILTPAGRTAVALLQGALTCSVHPLPRTIWSPPTLPACGSSLRGPPAGVGIDSATAPTFPIMPVNLGTASL